MESILKDYITLFLNENNTLNNCQHGFRSKRSCITQLLHVIEDFTKYMDDGKSIDVVYLDFKKAFDSVPHQRLFKKLDCYGIKGNVFNWIKSFLSDRKQRVTVKGEISNFKNVISGVPQGSVLGPLLFIIYINDLPNNIQCNCKLFADDTKIYGTSDQGQIIQNDIISLFKWSYQWQLDFNVSKCNVLHIGKNNPCNTYYTDVLLTKPLTTTNSEKDLGIIFDMNLSFDLHIDNCVNRANRMLGIIYRSFVYLDKFSFVSLYKSLIRSILEYGNCIWSPIYKRQSICLENVQRRATKAIREIEYLTYEERLKYLCLPSLKYRRLRGDLIQLFKIVHGIDDIESSYFFQYSNITFTRGDKYKIYVTRCSTNLRQNSFIMRTIRVWNDLDYNCKNAGSVNTFKNLIDEDLINLYYDHD